MHVTYAMIAAIEIGASKNVTNCSEADASRRRVRVNRQSWIGALDTESHLALIRGCEHPGRGRYSSMLYGLAAFAPSSSKALSSMAARSVGVLERPDLNVPPVLDESHKQFTNRSGNKLYIDDSPADSSC